MSKPKKCTVVGAGLVGLSVALEFQSRGFEVSIIDRAAPGMGASYGNAGFIATEAIDPLATFATIKGALSMWIDKHGALSIPAANLHRSIPLDGSICCQCYSPPG